MQIVEEPQAAYRALASRDPRFDGRIWFGVTTTGVYCRPICPAQTPRQENVRLFAAPAAAVTAGFRACKRCRPDAVPGTRQWDHRGDLVGKALGLIAHGGVDDGGVAAVAARLHVSERHLHRCLVDAVGASPLQLARSRRAQTARLLIEQTPMPLTDVAFAAGFSSIRTFNDVMRAEFGMAPRQVRRTHVAGPRASDPALRLRLAFRSPYDGAGVGAFLERRAIDGVEAHTAGESGWSHLRTVQLAHGVATITVSPSGGSLFLSCEAVDLCDVAELVRRVRRWLDLDAVPAAVADVLERDSALVPVVQARPGLRVVSSLHAWEALVRAIVGQQISVRGAVTILGRLAAAHGNDGSSFPTPEQLADVVLTGYGLTATRATTLTTVAHCVASGGVDLESGDPVQTLATLGALKGIGPWTTQYFAQRGLGDPDVLPVRDLGIRQGAHALGLADDERTLTARSLSWRPWRSYAAGYLWAVDTKKPTEEELIR